MPGANAGDLAGRDGPPKSIPVVDAERDELRAARRLRRGGGRVPRRGWTAIRRSTHRISTRAEPDRAGRGRIRPVRGPELG